MNSKLSQHKFDPVILREYDIRGIVPANIKDLDAYYVGKAFAAYINSAGINGKVCVGYDGRLTSVALNEALVNGLMESGINVVQLGLIPTPALYYATINLQCVGGIMITGSHNPPEYNGFKLMLENAPFYGDQIKKLAALAYEGKLVHGKATLEAKEIKHQYIAELLTKALGKINKKLKIAWDPGNGVTGAVVQALVKHIPGEHIVINAEIDGNFPAHHPDPTQEENMRQLITLVQQEDCDFGIAFDGDGDRIGVVDNVGRILNGEELLLIYAEDLLSRYKGAKIIADVKTSDVIFDRIRELGGQAIMWKTGHSHIKSKMKQEQALLAGEMSGHSFFGENYYGFDDAIFGACKLINIIANSESSFAQIVNRLPQRISTPEIKITVAEEHKFSQVEALKKILAAKNVTFADLDGVRVKEDTGWWLLRASNTQNCLIARIEGNKSSSDLISTVRKFLNYCQEAKIQVSAVEKYLADKL